MEKIAIQLPFRYEATFQDEGCFLFMKGIDVRITAQSTVESVNHTDAILLKCGTYFVDWININASDKVKVIAFHLPAKILKELYEQELPQSFVSSTEHKMVTTISKDKMLMSFIEGLEFYFENPGLINNDSLSLKIKELILLLLQSNKFQSVQDLLSNLFSQNELQFKQLIQTHLFSGISVPDLAKLSNRSLSSFKRDFQKQFGASPGDYILTQKLIKAKSLLSNTQLTVSEITFEIGMNDPSYFSRIFKSKTGLTPSQFRRRKK